jgi:hypothetical protein
MATEIAEIQRLVCRELATPLEELVGLSRERHIVRARHVAMYVCHDQLGVSFTRLAAAFGGRHRKTVMSAIHVTQARLEAQSELRDVVARVEAALRGLGIGPPAQVGDATADDVRRARSWAELKGLDLSVGGFVRSGTGPPVQAGAVQALIDAERELASLRRRARLAVRWKPVAAALWRALGGAAAALGRPSARLELVRNHWLDALDDKRWAPDAGESDAPSTLPASPREREADMNAIETAARAMAARKRTSARSLVRMLQQWRGDPFTRDGKEDT